MKKIIIVSSLLLSFLSFGQEYRTGDADLDASLKKIQAEAQLNLSAFKKDISTRFKVTVDKVENCFKVGMDAADALMAFEIAGLTRKPIEDVITVYKTSKSKGWGAMAKELGIKPGSAEFHALKGNAKGNAKDKNAPKKSENQKGNSGKGKSHGKSKGNSK